MGKWVVSVKLVEEYVVVTFLKGDASAHPKCCHSVLASGYNDPSAVRRPVGISLHGHGDPSAKPLTGMLLVRGNSR